MAKLYVSSVVSLRVPPVKLASLRDGFRALICPHGYDWWNIG